MNYLIATDLDGTLLDHHDYAYAAAKPALMLCRKLHIPVVFNTSKTASESIRLRGELDNQHPFIVENGSAVFIPVGYFPSMPKGCVEAGDYWIRRLGCTRMEILARLTVINDGESFRYAGFSQWSAEQIADKTGLSVASAREANRRDFSEPLIWLGDDRSFERFAARIRERGLKLLRGGRFWHLLGETDKGSALNWLKAQFERDSGQPLTLVALGDGANDADMLEVADVAVIVRSPVNPPPELAGGNRVIRTSGCGPEGWNEAIGELLGPQGD